MNIYNLYNAEAQFKKYLVAVKISSVSIRNYLSDFRYFCGWIQKLSVGNNLSVLINDRIKLFEEYSTYLSSSQIPVKTQKRRLSSLRKFYNFLIDEEIIDNQSVHPANTIRSDSVLISIQSEDYSHLLSNFKYELLLNENSAEAEKEVKNVTELLSFIQSN